MYFKKPSSGAKKKMKIKLKGRYKLGFGNINKKQ